MGSSIKLEEEEMHSSKRKRRLWSKLMESLRFLRNLKLSMLPSLREL